VLDLLKELLRPASISCVLALLAPGVALLFAPSLARWGDDGSPPCSFSTRC
jgi:hypothetical protein